MHAHVSHRLILRVSGLWTRHLQLPRVHCGCGCDTVSSNIRAGLEAIRWWREWRCLEVRAALHLKPYEPNKTFFPPWNRKEEDSIRERFDSLFNALFFNVAETGLFCYRCTSEVAPPLSNSLASSDFSDDEDARRSMMETSYENANDEWCVDAHAWMAQRNELGLHRCPFFVRLDYWLKYHTDEGVNDDGGGGGQQYTHRQLLTSVSTLPTHLSTLACAPDRLGYCKCLLKIVCLTIMNEEEESSDDERVSSPVSRDPLSGSTLDRRPSVGEPLEQLLNAVELRIQGQLSEEILNAVMFCRPITAPLLEIVRHNISKISSDAMDTIVLPLDFLDPNMGQNLLREELDRDFVVRLRRFGEVFFTVEDGSEAGRVPFWLISCVYGYNLKIWLYSKDGQGSVEFRRNLQRRVRDYIKWVVERINRKILLEEMHENRTCSTLLIPAVDAFSMRMSESGDSALEETDRVRMQKWPPGQVRCHSGSMHVGNARQEYLVCVRWSR